MAPRVYPKSPKSKLVKFIQTFKSLQPHFTHSLCTSCYLKRNENMKILKLTYARVNQLLEFQI